MGRERKQPESEQEAGAPEWMVTFSDCMTLLLTFFVLLLSFSSFDNKVFRNLRVVFVNKFSTGSKDKDAFLSTEVIQHNEELNKGSEKPTLKKGTADNLKEETEPANFHDRKVFLISSDKIFWGKGTVISLQGRKTLSAMASFLKEMPNRVVISENQQMGTKSGGHFGLQRAWAVIEYLTTKQGLDKRQFSISAVSTVAEDDAKESLVNSEQNLSTTRANRTLEIVLLERSIYN